jgi:hypothetical protein
MNGRMAAGGDERVLGGNYLCMERVKGFDERRKARCCVALWMKEQSKGGLRTRCPEGPFYRASPQMEVWIQRFFTRTSRLVAPAIGTFFFSSSLHLQAWLDV